MNAQIERNEKETTKTIEIELEVEELEEVIAPGRRFSGSGSNHNETLICDAEEVELEVEELEEVIAPVSGIRR